MPKNYKFLFYLGAFFLFILIGFLIVRSLTSPSTNPQGNNTQNGQNLPEYILGQDEENSVKEFVKNFVSLYNTYSYADYSNLRALGDYQTPAMQEKTIDYISNLETTTPAAFAINTEPLMDTFKYSYPEATKLLVSLQAKVTETTNQNESFSPRSSDAEKNYNVTINLELTRFGKNWLVNNFEIKK